MIVDRDPLHLHQLARDLDAQLAEKALAYGIGTTLIETARDNSGQLARWLQGRLPDGTITDRSKIVTWKKPGDSWHNLVWPDGTPCSLAFHRAIRCTRGEKIGLLGFGEFKLDAIAIEQYKVLGRIGISLGLRWGGNWDMDANLVEHGENDLTHFEAHGHGTLSQVKAALLSGVDIVDLRKA
jgi:hypothetical protein